MEHIVRLLARARLRRHRGDGRVPRQPHPQLLRRRLRVRRAHALRRPRTRRSAPPVRSRNAMDELDETFLVISGDVLTDIDLGAIVDAPRRTRGVGHHRLEAGREPGRVRHRHHPRRRHDRAVPREAHVGPGVLRHDQHRHLRARARGLRLHPRRRGRRLLERRVPALLDRRASRCSARSSTGYWEDVGTLEAYLRAHKDILDGQVAARHPRLPDRARACGSARAPRSRPTRMIDGPGASSATTAASRPARVLGEYTVLGADVV